MAQPIRKENNRPEPARGPQERDEVIGDKPIEKEDARKLELTPMRDAAAEARRREDDEENDIFDELRIDDQKRGEEWGTDETLNDGNSAQDAEPRHRRETRNVATEQE